MHHRARSRGSCTSPKLQLASESPVSSNFLHRPSNGCCCCSRLRLRLMVHVFLPRGRARREPSRDCLAAGASTRCSLAAWDYPSISPRARRRCLSVGLFFPMNPGYPAGLVDMQQAYRILYRIYHSIPYTNILAQSHFLNLLTFYCLGWRTPTF